MTMPGFSGVLSNRRLIASGQGWCIHDVVFCVGGDPGVFESRHDDVCIGAVTAGGFLYRSTRGAAALMPGAVLLGNAGDSFSCFYQPNLGDRCISFSFAPDYFDRIVEGVPAVRRCDFATHRIPPTSAAIALTAAVQSVISWNDAVRSEEVALRFAGNALTLLSGGEKKQRQPSRRDANRILDALCHIEQKANDRLSITDLAAAVCMSPYHFLRVFREVTAVTPYQYILRTRLRRTAIDLVTSKESISTIALENGFGDLSTFVANFRRVFGLAPREYRLAATSGLIPDAPIHVN